MRHRRVLQCTLITTRMGRDPPSATKVDGNMKRLGHWLFNIVTAVSLVFFWTIIAVWLYTATENRITLRRTMHGFALVPEGHLILSPPLGSPQLLETNWNVLIRFSRSRFSFL